MNNIDKVILLAEYYNVDVTNFKESYHLATSEGETMKKLEENINEAQKYNNARVHKLLEEYTQVIDTKVETFEDELIYNAKLNYLCSISYEQFYLNPFEIGANETKTKSIGELILKYDGRYVSFNDIILDSTHSFRYKSQAIKKQINIYHEEMTTLLAKPIKQIKNYKIKSENMVKHSRISSFFFSLFFVLFNIFLVFLLTFNGETFKSAQVIDFNNLFSYAYYLPFVCIILYDFAFVISDCLKKIDQENYYFAKRYLEFGKKHVYNSLSTQAAKLNNYIKDACKNHKILENDIKLFSKIGGDKLDLYGLMNAKHINDKMYYRFAFAIRYISFTLSLLASIFSIVMFTLNHYGLLGNISWVNINSLY